MRKKKILLVDDSTSILALQKAMLGGGYDLITASNGAEALAKAAEEAPDAILLDVVMPKLNGFDTCKALRQSPRTKETPVIMVTTRGDQESIDTGFACGCNDFVTKPIDVAELKLKLRRLLA